MDKTYTICYFSLIKGCFCKVDIQQEEVDEYLKEYNKLSDKMKKKFGLTVFDFIRASYEYNS